LKALLEASSIVAGRLIEAGTMARRRTPLVLAAIASLACAVPGPAAASVDAGAPSPEQDAAERAALAQAAAERPAGAYDRDGVSHNIQCIPTRDDRAVVLRDVEGEPLTAIRDGSEVQLSDQPLRALARPGARPCLRIQAIEAVVANGMSMYYTWPFEPQEVAAGAPAQYPGLVRGAELAARPVLDSGETRSYGLAAPAAPGSPAYVVTPQDINVPQQLYAGPSTGRYYSYSPYGKDVGGARFALMTWTWIDADGGGIARLPVAAGELFYPANVAPIDLQSVAADEHTPNGSVDARYGYVRHGAERSYGWMVTSHVVGSEGQERCVDQMEYAGGGPALAGTLCAAADAESAESPRWGPGVGVANLLIAAG
jgi:hypothetical protein